MRRTAPRRPGRPSGPTATGRRPGVRGRAAAALVAALAVTGALVVPPALADELDDRRAAAERRAEENAAAREATEASLEGLSGALEQATAELAAVQGQIPAAEQALAAAQAALDAAQREAGLIADRLRAAEDEEVGIGARITEGDARTAELRRAIGELARQAYRTGTTSTSLEVVLGATSVEDFAERYGLAATALRTQSQVLEQLTAAQSANRSAQARLAAVRERIVELKAEADAKVVEADRARAAAAAAKAELDRLLAEQQAKQAALEAQRGDLERQLAEQAAQEAALQSELSAIIAEQRARQPASAPPPSGSVSGALFGNPTSIVPMYVTSNFGMRLHPILGYTRLHAGIDLRTYCSTPLYAGRDGTVQWARARSGFGNQVMLDHGFVDGNSLMSSYNHMTRFVVGAGERVSKGQLIGYSGNTGTSAACHLHFEVYVNGNVTNPRPLLGL
ncbi:peptidoglycan DD-metalloendopeptidase family protein [Cellulomonas endophytica]|uniref:peptidoglycan DD-metalloendopeptidase family protein n=1 Tax=Cellulomonas endophytica TaxID=2494735 RepID=UPI001010878C|nr:M23 family metallopeptidase [Cellulomonas endophytica]